jgi:hypothetical protein
MNGLIGIGCFFLVWRDVEDVYMSTHHHRIVGVWYNVVRHSNDNDRSRSFGASLLYRLRLTLSQVAKKTRVVCHVPSWLELWNFSICFHLS